MLPQEIPFSTLFIFLLSATIALLTSLANRFLTDPEKTKVWRKEIAEWNTEVNKARRDGDKKRLEKLMKKQQHILQLQSKMAWQSMKVTFLFIIPLIIIWQFLGGVYAGSDIAYFPGIGPTLPLPLLGNMASLYWWYLICSFFFSTTFSHVFKLIDVE
jgi:uncharacterized membrane protein (DUF106 family)